MNTEEFRCALSLYTAKGCSRGEVVKPLGFYNFTKREVLTDLEERRNNSAKVDQCNTGLCGIAAIAYMYSSRYYEHYRDFVLRMHQF
jgi:hypothetical protein